MVSVLKLLQKVTRMEMKIYFPGKKKLILPESFPEKYRGAVIQSANLCAVKKHMETPPEFNVFTSR